MAVGYKLPMTYETEIFVNDESSVTIKQTDPYGDDCLVVFQPYELTAVIRILLMLMRDELDPEAIRVHGGKISPKDFEKAGVDLNLPVEPFQLTQETTG